MNLYQEEMNALKQTIENIGPEGKTSEELINDYEKILDNKNIEKRLVNFNFGETEFKAIPLEFHELTFRK